VYGGGARPAGCGEHAAVFVPLIALFAGMRIEEICQLRVSDIRRVGKRGWYISVIDGEDQSLKTITSRRFVPIHPELQRIGLIALCQKKRAEGQEWLFHDLPVDKYGRRSSMFSKKWSIYVRCILGMKADDHRKSFHSFRHSFKQFARSCGIPEDIHDFLTGHGKNSEARKYGDSAYPEEPLFEAVRRYEIPGLDLSHLYARRLARQRTMGYRKAA
jgi:integrase